MCRARQVLQWPASSIPCCGCKYSWEEDLATVPSSPPHIAFPEVKCQTSLKYHPGLQPTRASGGGQPGSPPGFCPDLWRCAAQRHKSGHTSDNVMGGWRAFCQSRDTNMGRVGTGTAPGRTACFSFSIKDSKKKKTCPALVAVRKIVPELSSGGTGNVVGDSCCFALLLLFK